MPRLRDACRALSISSSLLCLLCTGTARAEKKLPDWLLLDAEYRIESTYVDPFELSGALVDHLLVTEQRLRLDLGLNVAGVVQLRTQTDVLGGVLFGDNGDYSASSAPGGKAPVPSSGLAVTTRWPNVATWDIGLIEGGDRFDPDSYGVVLRGIEPIRVNRIWADVNLPFGLLRIGRQPSTTGPGINLHDGSRSNRWGVSRYASTADRFMFATKISEAFRMIGAGEDFVADRSMDDGVFIGGAYDVTVQDDVTTGGDDLHQALGFVQWRVKKPEWFGLEWDPLLVQVVFGGRFGDEYDTQVFAIPITFELGVGPVHLLAELVTVVGHTREASEGMAALRETDQAKRVVYDQDLLMFGAKAVVDVEIGPVVATLEFDYASGDADPRDETPLTTYNFARDSNVGLLLFEHILAFETARSAQVGVENLGQFGAKAFPITELRSDGRVHNAIVLFPQVLYRPVEPLGIRFGAMFAWSAAPVTDPIMTILNEDGVEIEDDAVNWHGGKPARYYGTELDLQVEWSYKGHFLWTLEAAVLFPGDALHDESGDAVTAFLVENRFTVVF